MNFMLHMQHDGDFINELLQFSKVGNAGVFGELMSNHTNT